MSHLDELDEYEAKLELRLKKEYSDVFGLFRFCVVTQDSTYLCNRHELRVLPQTSYPFFHLTMEDVWVWDKNRRGLHLERRHDRGAARRGRGADPHAGGAGREARRDAHGRRRNLLGRL